MRWGGPENRARDAGEKRPAVLATFDYDFDRIPGLIRWQPPAATKAIYLTQQFRFKTGSKDASVELADPSRPLTNHSGFPVPVTIGLPARS